MSILRTILPLNELPIHPACKMKSNHNVSCRCGLQIFAQSPQSILHIVLPFRRCIGIRPVHSLVLRIKRSRIVSAKRTERRAPTHTLFIDKDCIGIALKKIFIRIKIHIHNDAGSWIRLMDSQKSFLHAREIELAGLFVAHSLIKCRIEK